MTRTLTDVSTEELRAMTVRMWDDDVTDELMCETTLEGRHLTGRSHTIACRRDGHEVYELHLLAEPRRQPVGR